MTVLFRDEARGFVAFLPRRGLETRSGLFLQYNVPKKTFSHFLAFCKTRPLLFYCI